MHALHQQRKNQHLTDTYSTERILYITISSSQPEYTKQKFQHTSITSLCVSEYSKPLLSIGVCDDEKIAIFTKDS